MKTSLTEKLGLWYFKQIYTAYDIDAAQNDPFNLTEKERKTIKRNLQKAVVNAVIVGLLSSFAAFAFAYYIRKEVVHFKDFIQEENIPYLIAFVGVTILLSLLEMIILFLDTMGKSLKLVYAGARELFPPEDHNMDFARIITRAALELPNPQKSEIKLDPLKYSSKARRVTKKILYKAKASITKLFLKSIIQRAIGKALSRVYFTILAMPVIAFWNGYESYKIMTEVKIRVIGPAAVRDFTNYFKKTGNNMSNTAKLQMVKAVGTSVVLAEDLHPNLKLLYTELIKVSGMNIRNATLDNPKLFLKRLNEINPTEQEFALKTLEYSTMLTGRLNYRQKRFLRQAYEVCSKEYSLESIRKMRRLFKSGRIAV